MESELLDLFGRCLEIHDTDGLEAAEEFCREHPTHAKELKRRLDLLEGVGLLESDAETEAIPRTVGEFEVLDRIGGGGMGVVFRARQSSLDREVALKLVRPDHAWIERARERFRREVEAVANLHHPGIVPIYAVGESDGLPWFAMELIDGCTLDQAIAHLRGRDPATLTGADLAQAVSEASGVAPGDGQPAWIFDGSWSEACCRVISQIAGALEHAHRRGVLHRDVKPANIMLTAAGRVMLVDFGVARTDRGEAMTRTGARLGTPAYMSPEQLRGDHVDVRADVYSLGVTLHEALTLERAFSNRSEEGLLRDIREGACPSVRSRVPSVARDLDVICRVAMDPDAERRYSSADDMRRDLEAVLSLRPIEARRPTPLVRLKRWMQRNPTLSVAAVLGFLLVVVGPMIYAVRMQAANARTSDALGQAKAQALRAEENYDRAVTALGVMTDIAEDLRAVPGMDGVRNDILDSVLEFHLDLVEQKSDDMHERARVVDSMRSAAKIRSFRGRHEEALSMQQRAVDEILRLQEKSERSFDRFYLAVAHVERGRYLCSLSRFQESDEDVKAALEILGELEGNEERVETFMARALFLQATNHRALGRFGQARSSLEASTALLDRLVERTDSPRHRKALARSLADLAELGVPEADSHSRRAIAILEEVAEEDPRDYYSATFLAGALDSAGRRAALAGRYEEAAGYQRRAIDQLSSLAREFPNVWTLQRNVAVLRLNLGITMGRLEEYAEGIELIAQARETLEELLGRRPDDLAVRVQVAATLTESSRIRRYTSDYDGAVQDLERAVELIDSALAAQPDHARWQQQRLAMLANLGDGYVMVLDHEGAFEVSRRFFALSLDVLDFYSAAKLTGSCAQLVISDGSLDAEERRELLEEYLDEAFKQLGAAVDAGFDNVEKLETGPRMTEIRKDPRYPGFLREFRERLSRESR